MIRINFEYTPEYLISYVGTLFHDFLTIELEKYLSAMNRENAGIKNRILEYFTKEKITEIIIAKPTALVDLINEIHNDFPEIKEFYTTEYFFEGKVFPTFYYIEHDFRAPVDVDLFNEKIEVYIDLLLQLNENSIIIKDTINKLRAINTQSKCKEVIQNFTSIINGNTKAKNIFPAWVKTITSLFNYDKLSKPLAYDLVETLDINCCPYCNQSDLHFKTTDDEHIRDYRPSLDHFYPKSRYPFLALSIYNLIPSCEFCNETMKRDLDTFTTEHALPHILGVADAPLFTFESHLISTAFDSLSTEDINILINQHCEAINNNINMFDLIPRYNTDYYKNRFLSYLQARQSIKSWGLNPVAAVGLEEIVSGELTKRLPPTKSKNKKFELDLYNQVLDKQLNLY